MSTVCGLVADAAEWKDKGIWDDRSRAGETDWRAAEETSRCSQRDWRLPAQVLGKAGMPPLPGGRWYCVIPYGTWVPVAVRLLANCYTLFTVTFTFTTVSPTKTAEPTEIPFGLWTRVDPGYHVLDGGPDSPGEWAILRVPPFEMHHNSKFSEDGCIKCSIYILIYLQTVLGLSSIQAI